MNFNYPDTLPVSRQRERILETLRNNQVVIIAGDTGSGKTTQLPKMCLELQLHSSGRIGCTQPRRIAALTVSSRVAEELGEFGHTVGYKIRFQDRTNKGTRIKFMTDGVLLAETRKNRLLPDYDVLIIDEAHERSLNIDFLLGHLKNILPQRPDLKIIVTSATIDTEAFSKHFNNAPIVSIPGKTYPVEVRYSPPDPDEYGELENYIDCCVSAVRQLYTIEPPGDMLVFLPTERDIRNCCDILRKKIPDAEVLPLFGRLHTGDQKKIFLPSKRTKIVVATNVAETSITVPGIRYVVDTGLARMAFYNFRAKTNSLPIQKISRAGCDQRKGRCGRVAPGVCVRLFEEEDYLGREEYSIPEIRRSNLAEVILQMLSYQLGDPSTFPFIDPPLASAINDGYNQLLELGAISGERRLTAIGKKMASMPIDPSISRIVIEAKENNCLKEIMAIATVLAIQDPRVRPSAFEKQADESHEQFIDMQSDFLTFLNIWNLFHKVKTKTSWSRLKKFCKSHFLSFQRMREWIDLHDQMVNILQSQGQLQMNTEDADYNAIHMSLAAGFLRNIAMKKEGGYLGASGKELVIFPGSGQYRKKPSWIIASSFLETSRLYALNAARIEPEWLEKPGGRLCKYSWFNPRYHKKSGRVIAEEKVSLFGLPIIASRKVDFGRTNDANREEARSIFLQSALLEGNLSGSYDFLQHNINLVKNWEDVENRLRTRDILTNETAILQFYQDRLPLSVYDRFTLNRFLKKKKNDAFLKLKEEDVIARTPQDRELADFPPVLTIGSHSLNLEYVFDPASEQDGVTVRIPQALADILRNDIFEWLVPGLIKEKTTYLLKSLPKKIRKHLVPLNIAVDKVLDDIEMYKGSYYRAIEASIFKHFQISVKRSDWTDQLPIHLQMRFVLFDLSGKEVACSRDFSFITSKSETPTPVSLQRAAPKEQETMQQWEEILTATWAFDDLPVNIPLFSDSKEIAGFLYPAVTPVYEKASVTIRFHSTSKKAETETRAGMRYLYRLQFSAQYKSLKNYCSTNLSGPSSLWLVNIFQKKAEAVDSLLNFIVDTVFSTAQGEIPSRQIFEQKIEKARKTNFFDTGKNICDEVLSLLRKRREVISEISRHEELAKKTRTHSAPQYTEYQRMLGEILPDNFLEDFSYDLTDRQRYLQCLIIRIARAHSDLAKDMKKAEMIAPHAQNLATLQEKEKDLSDHCKEKMRIYERMVHEMRIAVFSPELKTALPVSQKKLKTTWRDICEQC
ncbi:ATP-dependent RNA helicase HrpA [Desulfopila inferna]|uniref:ATP-dependent RNA helicase HrpA n=1 Tax=Desulfopila inferna TaxID=468528 RepID=UPI001963FD79|nr:ATP-dependent RNA helicase HrpA [Desulfopila inferna]MBM9602749.1 ATP-dependent RNA helicase HrpA [Desulfopila inferna]